jgi:hypothetical protein
LFGSELKPIFAPSNLKIMAVTRLKRKDRRNKEMTRVRKTNLKNVNKMVYIQSPFKGTSGIVLEDQA